MDEQSYPIEVEVEGKLGMFKQAHDGSEATSSIVPPYSAVKGMFESILFIPLAEVVPVRVHICFDPRMVEAGFNCHASHMRKDSQVSSGNPLLVRQNLLFKPCYQLFAVVRNLRDCPKSPPDGQGWQIVAEAHYW
jgi:CRISPR-associated protein Cas5d